MKNITALSLLMTFSSLAFAQEDAISKFFGKYEMDEDFTHVTITSRMFGLFANLDTEDEEDKELIDAVSKVKGLKIIAKDDITKEEADALYKEAFELIPTKDYDELMSVREKDNDMKFLIQEKNGVITELLMVMHGDNEFFLLSLIGDIDLKQISRLSKTMNIDGFEHLKAIDKDEH
ncbi:MAG: hypothetical protein DRI71_11545 [Bacteroidetes bacterium]|nr:MAG: hypothetical protein DRI71_11545 [Bacteroidota bacterium]